MRKAGDIIECLRQQDYVMVNPELGRGSFGQTVLLKDSYLDELFVAKKYAPEWQKDKEPFFKTFLQEIKILYRLNHRNIVRIFNYYIYEKAWTGIILMEYVEGQNIAEYLESCPPWDKIIDDVFMQLVDGFLHIEANGIIHRDIREGNILIANNGVVKIIDFGLGKLFKPTEASSADSMRGEIRRSDADSQPEEYYQGKYDILTDMFYLAELFHRLLVNNSMIGCFSYTGILKKMMKEKREDRYTSFGEVKKAIGKKDFSTLEISEKDKEVYQNFANGLCNCLACFTEERQFKQDVDGFLKKLDDILQKNCLENVIQRNDDLLSCIIDCGYRYRMKSEIQVETVKAFREWLGGLHAKTQELVLNNISYKLSRIKIECPEGDIPF